MKKPSWAVFSSMSSLCSFLTDSENIGKRWAKISLLEQVVWRCSTILKISENSQEVRADEVILREFQTIDCTA